MSEFKTFQKAIQQQFAKMVETGRLFKSKITGREVWKIYIDGFQEGENPTFRDPQSSSHNCNNCNNFIKRYGNLVAITEEGKIISLFSNLNTIEPYNLLAKKIDFILKANPIAKVFVETFNELNETNYERCNKTQAVYQLGVASNLKRYTKEEAELYGTVKPNETRRFYHFNVAIPKEFIDKSGKSVEELTAGYTDKYSVLKRALGELPLDTLNLVRDLITQGSLLDGTSYLHALEEFIAAKSLYNNTSWDKDFWLWTYSANLSTRAAKFKNTLIGVLCTELAEGMEINKACRNWNKRVDPVNYMKATAPITKKQIAEAQKFVEENGYESAFDRRFATMDDIKASEILHLNEGEVKAVSIFDNVKATSTRHKRAEFDKLEEVSIDKFMKDILPGCTSVEAYLENRMDGNLVTLTKASDDVSKPIFKWDNNYSWTFNGNLAGKSQIKENVKSAGGNVTGFLRFSIQWNDEDTKGIVDWDAHCRTPYTEIYYSHMNCRNTKGFLDVDMINPSEIGVENITWKNRNSIKDGKYEFFNRNFNGRNNNGFKAEIELNGETYNYQINGNLKGDTKVATVTVEKGHFSIEHHLPETNSSKELWGLESNNFYKVNLMCLSPNHWELNNVGNKHYMFMLENCKADAPIRGFHNENLIPDLLTHRKVMEVLGASSMIKPVNKQLSGLGFNSTVRDELIVKCAGTFKRMLKIKF